MRDRKVYIVYYGDYEHVQDIEAVFDSKDKVNAFKKRFAKNEKLKVVELILNPDFISNKDKVPYLVSFDEESEKPLDVITLFSIEDCDLAAKETTRTEGGQHYIYLFAANKKAAVIAAKRKKKECFAL